MLKGFSKLLAPALALVAAMFCLVAAPARAENVTPFYYASGVATVSSTISSATASSSFTPLAGRMFHIQLSGTAVISCTLERQLDGATWTPITVTAGGSTTTMYQWTYASALSEDAIELQANVPYRLDCGVLNGAYTSGALTVKFSQ